MRAGFTNLGFNATNRRFGTYWDRTEASRAWSRRFFERHGAMPKSQAAVYSAVRHYLKAIEAAGRTMPSASSPRCARRQSTTSLPRTATSVRMAAWCTTCTLPKSSRPKPLATRRDTRIIRTVPGEQAFRPLSESECALVKR